MDFAQLLQQGTAHAWLYIPVAILLGALHGLEPGHSKTMMAAFIIAVRGTVWRPARLGFAPPPRTPRRHRRRWYTRRRQHHWCPPD